VSSQEPETEDLTRVYKVKALPGIDAAFSKPPMIRKISGVQVSITPSKVYMPLKQMTAPVLDHMAAAI
jgi:hypothetical protein